MIEILVLQARVDNIDVHSCKVVYQGKELEKGVPFRFLNLPASAIVTLVTGRERVYGIQSDRSAPSRSTAQAAPKTVVNQKTELMQKGCASTSEGTSLSLEGVYLFPSTEELRGSRAHYQEEIDYEVNEKDAYAIQASLSKHVAPSHLRTNKMRENDLERKMAQMSPVLIRIEFPNNMTAQFEISAKSTCQRIYDMARLLIRPELQKCMTLFTAPPKQVLANSSTSVYEAGLAPAARLKIEFEDDIDHYDTIFSTDAANIEQKLPPYSYKPVGESQGERREQETVVPVSKEKKVPKWLNLGPKK